MEFNNDEYDDECDNDEEEYDDDDNDTSDDSDEKDNRDGERGRIVIEVRDEDENPVENARVDIETPMLGPGSGFTSAGFTDKSGHVTISDPDYVKPISESALNTIYVNGQKTDEGGDLPPGGYVVHKK